jgi:hypothetical protein
MISCEDHPLFGKEKNAIQLVACAGIMVELADPFTLPSVHQSITLF